jgi:hypothetical protein
MWYLISRGLAIAITAAVSLRVWMLDHHLWFAAFVLGLPLVLIWFPEEIDDLSFGTWDRGNQINVHTPAFLISAFGWAILLLEAWVIFLSQAFSRHFHG